MEFPVDIIVKMLGWHSRVELRDGVGRIVGFVPPIQKPGFMPIYADEGLSELIYTIRAEHAFTHWFEDASGRRFGEYGVLPTQAGKSVNIDGQPRFRFVHGSEWLDTVDMMVPSLPLLNGLTGLFVRPRTLAVRVEDGQDVLCMVKQRQLIDICYSVRLLQDVPGIEQECLLLSALVDSHLDLITRT